MKTLPTLRRRSSAGFSLAELMVVIVIIGLLATLVVPNVIAKLSVASTGKAKSDITQIVQSLDQYAIQNGGRYPDSLEALVTPNENGDTYLNQDSVPIDPWKNEYQYDPPQSGQPKPRVYTFGADGVPGGEGKDLDFDNFDVMRGDV